MNSEKYRKIYSMIVGNMNTVLEGHNTEGLLSGIEEYLVDPKDIDLLKKKYYIQIPDNDPVLLLVCLAINTKMLKFVFEANAVEAFETLRNNREWHLLYHSFDEVMPDAQIYKQCYPVQRMIFDSDYSDRIQEKARMICGRLYQKLFRKINKNFDFKKSRLLQIIKADDEEAEELDLLINEKRAVNLMYISGILNDAVGSVLAQKYYSVPEEQRGAFLLRITEIAQGRCPTTLLTAEIINDLFVHEDNMEDDT